MYRDNLEGLTEQIRALEEQRLRLEADLVGMKNMKRPQRALRVTLAALVLAAVGFAGGALGYRHAVIQLQEASRDDARTALRRIERCNERLKEVRALQGDVTYNELDEGAWPGP